MDLPACVQSAASHYGLPYSLIKAVVYVESRGNPLAVNRSNRNGTEDIGLMQINTVWRPVLHRYGIGKEDLKNPCINAIAGSWILRKYYVKTGNWVDALSAYNAGPSRLNVGRKYALKVIRYWYQFRGEMTSVSYSK